MLGPTTVERVLRVVADVGIILAAIAIGVVLFRNRELLLNRPTPLLRPTTVSKGQKLSLPGIDWNRNDKTIVLALSANCEYCARGGSFYARLLTESRRLPGLEMVVTLPEPPAVARKFVKQLGLTVKDVLQASPLELGVRGTPTILLLDSNGVVQGVWEGALGPDEEMHVLEAVSAR